ncbi:MAG: preprotein translocase subunit SecE [Clostridiales Family XIII bacterium]|jgi:preprotein translocase subunit SecE|nr:preprotein translocase subunit SecE [Clostridiales Family XIII bacterium]
MADKVKDKSRARLKERQKATMPEAAQKDSKEKAKSALARGVQRQKNEQAAAKKAAPKSAPAQPQQQEKKRGGLAEYFRGVRIETRKVVWPTRKELVSYTVVVFIACAFFGLFLWGVDSGFLAIIREVFDISMN